MPTYQYACTECGHSFEQFQSFSEDALTVCPVCEGKLRKLFNAVGVVFKGSGFYRNDSRSDLHVVRRVGRRRRSDSATSDSSTPRRRVRRPAPRRSSSSTSSSLLVVLVDCRRRRAPSSSTAPPVGRGARAADPSPSPCGEPERAPAVAA